LREKSETRLGVYGAFHLLKYWTEGLLYWRKRPYRLDVCVSRQCLQRSKLRTLVPFIEVLRRSRRSSIREFRLSIPENRNIWTALWPSRGKTGALPSEISDLIPPNPTPAYGHYYPVQSHVHPWRNCGICWLPWWMDIIRRFISRRPRAIIHCQSSVSRGKCGGRGNILMHISNAPLDIHQELALLALVGFSTPNGTNRHPRHYALHFAAARTFNPLIRGRQIDNSGVIRLPSGGKIYKRIGRSNYPAAGEGGDWAGLSWRRSL
jgi:hypothetical protein